MGTAGNERAVASDWDRPALPGTVRPKRFRPRFHYELLACGVAGHELVGLDARELRPQDAIFAREAPDGLRWYRCLRCDSWLPLPPPENPTEEHPPEREELALPLRGRPLRDKVVLRIIAIDRAVHFVILGVIAAAILVFAANQQELRGPAYRILADLQSGLGAASNGHGILYDVRRLFSVQSGTLTKIGLVVAAYAVLEGIEAVGLWLLKRWAEYLTFLATTLLLPLEVYELSHKFSVLKIITLIINIAVVIYLLFAKRLFGLRGGAAADDAERERDAGWEALERSTPGPLPSTDCSGKDVVQAP
jgi:uncharacterized membrane protein (DUF2068 family)